MIMRMRWGVVFALGTAWAMDGVPQFDVTQAQRLVACWQAEDRALVQKSQPRSCTCRLFSCLACAVKVGRRFAPVIALSTLLGRAQGVLLGKPACGDPCHDQSACRIDQLACRQRVIGQVAERVTTFADGHTCVSIAGTLAAARPSCPDHLPVCECYKTDAGAWQLWCFRALSGQELARRRLERSRVHGYTR